MSVPGGFVCGLGSRGGEQVEGNGPIWCPSWADVQEHVVPVKGFFVVYHESTVRVG